MVHVLAVAHHYFVGSFDDDANYILTAHALLDGQGLAGHLTSGDAVVGGYPPGYPALLVPLVWLFPHTFVPLRVATALSFACTFPLTWYYLGLRRVPEPVRVATMALMALNPVLATFGSMVMAEMPFLCALLVFLIAVDRWEATDKVVSPTGVAVVLLGAELVWLKEAGVGMTIGLVLWLGLRRRWAKAAAVAAGLVALLLPVVVARLIDHVPLAGSRYSQELGAYYSGGLLGRLSHVLPNGLWTYLTTALPRTLVGTGAPLPQVGLWHTVIRFVWWQIPVFTILGVIVTVRRRRDASVVIVGVYVVETMLWPQVNERRVVLAAPVLIAWYALGLWTAAVWLLRLVRCATASPQALRPGRRRLGARRSRTWPPLTAGGAMVSVVALVVVVPLLAQFSRDYLFGLHQVSSRPQGSRYMQALAALPVADTLVETDYRYTTALFTGHRTADNAFLAEIANGTCSAGVARTALAGDDAGYLLIGAVNKPDLIDNPCLFGLATTSPWAVRLLRTTRDEASVFELIGPGTAHPDLVNLMAGATVSGSAGLHPVPVGSAGAGDHPGSSETTRTEDGTASLTWSFGASRAISQVSVGEAGLVGDLADGVELQVEEPDGAWVTVADAAHAVGDGSDHAPYLLATLSDGTRARAVRVVVHGTGEAVALDVNALGPAGRSLP